MVYLTILDNWRGRTFPKANTRSRLHVLKVIAASLVVAFVGDVSLYSWVVITRLLRDIAIDRDTITFLVKSTSHSTRTTTDRIKEAVLVLQGDDHSLEFTKEIWKGNVTGDARTENPSQVITMDDVKNDSSSDASISADWSKMIPVGQLNIQPQSLCFLFHPLGLGSQLLNLFVNAAYFKDKQNRSLCIIESHYSYRFNASVGVLTGFFTPHFPVIDVPEQYPYLQ